MKPISTSIYTFENLRKYDCVYVDKTKYLYDLIKKPNGQFFCSRPRRFGKSLTISTLEAIFSGKRELFKELYIDSTDYDWDTYPVIHIDFGRADIENMDSLKGSLFNMLERCAKRYDVSIDATYPAQMFELLIAKLHDKTGKGVVLLIDECDKPILDCVASIDEAENYREFIANFYQIIKGSERYLRFVFITGVTKFAKVSILHKLNNLDDITMSSDYGTMFGYTQDEIETHFADYIEAATVETGMTREKLLCDMKTWYGGYKFTGESEIVYNPVSVGEFFNNHASFDNHWCTMGGSAFLMMLLRKGDVTQADIEDRILTSNAFLPSDISSSSISEPQDERITQTLFDTGYLTINKELWDEPFIAYQMKIPNKEAELSLKIVV